MLTQTDGASAVPPTESAAERARNRRRAPVRRLRFALAVFAVGVGVAVVGQASLRTFASNKLQTQAADTPLVLNKPRFTGVLKDGRAFLITADAAVRDAANQDHVSLDKPVIVRGVGSPEVMRTTAEHGVYQEDDGVLVLTGDVKVDNGDGYRFATQQARIDTKTGAVVGDTALAAQGPNAQIRSDSYSVQDKGDRMVFKGRVRSTIQPR